MSNMTTLAPVMLVMPGFGLQGAYTPWSRIHGGVQAKTIEGDHHALRERRVGGSVALPRTEPAQQLCGSVPRGLRRTWSSAGTTSKSITSSDSFSGPRTRHMPGFPEDG
jgi:hypothetical protein